MRLVRPWMWVAVFVAIVAVFFVLPQVSLAGDPLDTPLVSVCDKVEESGFIGACQLCDLVTLARNIINFSIAFSMVVATLLFAYAGFMYYTAASSPDNIKKAHGVFTKTFTGIIIILAAWLVVNLLLITIAGEDLSIPNLTGELECQSYPTSDPLPGLSSRPAVTGGGRGPARALDTGPRFTNQQAQNALAVARIATSSSGSCMDQSRRTCTSLEGIPQRVITQLRLIRQNCNCEVVVTGGTETGHDVHGSGYPIVDLRFNETLANYLKTNYQNVGITRICTRSQESSYSLNCPGNPESVRQLHVEF